MPGNAMVLSRVRDATLPYWLIAGLVPFGSANVYANHGLATPTVLPEITVTAPTRTERAIERSPTSVEVITAADIAQTGAVSLTDVLRSHSTLYVNTDGTLASIRGVNREDTLFLLNGRRISGESSRRYELSRMMAAQIERIEIIKGPGSVMYGSDALGGVINIITTQPADGFSGHVDVQVGTRLDGGSENLTAGFTLSGGHETTQLSLYANATTRNAYQQDATAHVGVTGQRVAPSTHGGAASPVRAIADTYTLDEDRLDDADVYNLGLGLRHHFSAQLQGEFDIGWMQESRKKDYINAGRVDTHYTSANGNTIPAFNVPMRWRDENTRLDLSGALIWQMHAQTELQYRISQSLYDKDRTVEILPWQDFGFADQRASDSGGASFKIEQRTHELTGSWQAHRDSTLLGGVEYRDHLIEGDSRRDTGWFVQHEWQAKPRLDVVYGARYDQTSIGESSTSIKAGSTYRLHETAHLRLNFAQGFKVPEIRDFTANRINPQGVRILGANVIDPAFGKTRHSLMPERSETYEIGLQGRLNVARYEITVFQTDIKDRVEQVREQPLDTEYMTFRNVGSARIQGLETQWQWPLTEHIRLDLAATWLDAINRDTQLQLTNAPEFMARSGVRFAPTDNVSTRLQARYVGSRYIDAANTDEEESYTVFDLNLGYYPLQWDAIEFYGGIENLLDVRNETSLYADPGRFLRVGMRYFF